MNSFSNPWRGRAASPLSPLAPLAPLAPIAAAMLACLPAPGFCREAADEGKTLAPVQVEGRRSVAERNHLPATTESVTRDKAADTVNAMTVEDTVKYLPNILVRRRFIGDTQAPMSSRTTGINASARTLLYADGIPLSTLINNNNQNGSPQWFMVSPEEIERIDVMYGPFSAMYPGNSYGAVTEITTRMPRGFEASVKAGLSSQRFSQYGSSDSYRAGQLGATLGNRVGPWSWWFSVNHLDSDSQPVTYLTATPVNAPAAGLPIASGGFLDRNRSGSPILVAGAGNLTHTVQDSAKIKVGYDFSPALAATYILGYWQNRADASSQSYLAAANGAPYFGAAGGNVNIGGTAYSAQAIGSAFASSRSEQEHWMHSLALRSKATGPWSWEAQASYFAYGRDLARTSTGLYPAAQNGGAGRIQDNGDTGWGSVDLKGSYRSPGKTHLLSFGAHLDQYRLASPTYTTTDWVSGANGALSSDSRGKTRTAALWVQDLWALSPELAATLGARYEDWRAYEGYNLAVAGATAFPVVQPEVRKRGISPKASLSWQASETWSVTGSVGKALRFPTVGELYQNVQTGAVFTQANPFLKPENVLAGELAAEHKNEKGRLRISLFEEEVSDALIAQTSTIAGVAAPVSFTQNVGKTRQQGIELVGERRDVGIKGLELSGSATYVDAKIVSNPGYVPTIAGASSVGKRTPYVPRWRATLAATYKPNEKWAWTLAGRYSSRMYATVDNTDINPSTYQGFESFFVADARVRYRFDRHWSAAAGVDNLNNRKYYLFHPFPQRTLYAELKYDY